MRRVLLIQAVSFVLGLGLLQTLTASAQAVPALRITQVDRSNFPSVRVYVVVDSAPAGVSTPLVDVNIVISDRGREVLSVPFREGKVLGVTESLVSVVLVLDLSDSMAGEKLAAAKEAARAFVDMAPRNFEIAVVGFSDQARRLCDFTQDKDYLQHVVEPLTSSGSTAFQDGIGVAVDLIGTRAGRRQIVALTDGNENKSSRFAAEEGRAELLRLLAERDCSVTTVGLGADVNKDYLKSYEVTGGHSHFSPSSAELQLAFAEAEQSLSSERFFDYVASGATADGGRHEIEAHLAQGGQLGKSTSTQYVSPGLIPHVRGNHLPYLIVLVVLLYLPQMNALARGVRETALFHRSYVRCLTPDDGAVGRRDLNMGAEGPTLGAGDVVVECPECDTAHHVRSWRLNRCRCMHENRGQGHYCFHRYLPAWARRALDWCTGQPTDSRGRRWLCRCAGDKEGY